MHVPRQHTHAGHVLAIEAILAAICELHGNRSRAGHDGWAVADAPSAPALQWLQEQPIVPCWGLCRAVVQVDALGAWGLQEAFIRRCMPVIVLQID